MRQASLGTAFVMIAIIWSKSVVALSCVPMTDLYFLACKSGKCSVELGIGEVPGFGPCGRRPLVHVISPSDQEILESTVQISKHLKDDGLYRVKLQISYWSRAFETGTDSFRTAAKHMLERYSRDPIEPLDNFDQVDIAEMLDANFSPGWLTYISPDVNGVETIENEQREKIWRGRVRHYGGYIFSWGTALAALVVLVISTQIVFQRLFKSDVAGKKSITGPVLLQICVFLVAGMSLLSSTFQLWPGAILAPAAVVILLAEFWSMWRFRNGI